MIEIKEGLVVLSTRDVMEAIAYWLKDNKAINVDLERVHELTATSDLFVFEFEEKP